eukprot:14052755-Alexandrium_andersonii.AAC.1
MLLIAFEVVTGTQVEAPRQAQASQVQARTNVREILRAFRLACRRLVGCALAARHQGIHSFIAGLAESGRL